MLSVLNRRLTSVQCLRWHLWTSQNRSLFYDSNTLLHLIWNDGFKCLTMSFNFAFIFFMHWELLKQILTSRPNIMPRRQQLLCCDTACVTWNWTSQHTQCYIQFSFTSLRLRTIWNALKWLCDSCTEFRSLFNDSYSLFEYDLNDGFLCWNDFVTTHQAV